MANTSRTADEAPAGESFRMLAKALPESARLSPGDRSCHRPRWLVWLGAAVVVSAALYSGLVILGVAAALLAGLYWGVMTYVDRVGREFSLDQKQTLASLGRQAGALLTLDRALDRAQDQSAHAAAADSVAPILPHFKTFLDHLPSTAFIKDSEYRYVFANRALARSFMAARVKPTRQPPVRLLDVGDRRVAIEPEDDVEVHLCLVNDLRVNHAFLRVAGAGRGRAAGVLRARARL